MPIRRHFWKRQAWQALRLRLLISQLLVAGHVYSMLPGNAKHSIIGCQALDVELQTLDGALEEGFACFTRGYTVVEA